MFFGKLSVKVGSNRAYLGINLGLLTAYFSFNLESTITAAKVASLPVPEVVGMAINKGSFLLIFN